MTWILLGTLVAIRWGMHRGERAVSRGKNHEFEILEEQLSGKGRQKAEGFGLRATVWKLYGEQLERMPSPREHGEGREPEL